MSRIAEVRSELSALEALRVDLLRKMGDTPKHGAKWRGMRLSLSDLNHAIAAHREALANEFQPSMFAREQRGAR